jgi:hypothetical protein
MHGESIAAAHAAVAAACSRFESDSAALKVGKQHLAAAQAQLDKLAAEDQAAVERHARRLTQSAREGQSGQLPALVPSDRHLAAIATARSTHAASTASVATLEAAARDSEAALTAAEAAMEQAVLASLAPEGDALAEQILARDAETEQMRELLRGLRALIPPSALVRRAAPMEGDWIHTPMPELRAAPTSTVARDPLHTPLNKIGTSEAGPAAVEYWRARRALLLSGEDSEPMSATAERAA